MKEWHEHIQKQGVLCKFSSDEKLFVHIEDTQDFLEFLSDYACEPESLTPLTSAEMWQLMPWQPIETAPLDEFVFVKWSNGKVSPHKLSTLKHDAVANVIGWLPLPKGDL